MREIEFKPDHVALVDDEDYEKVSKYEWRLRISHGNNKYAIHKKRLETGKLTTESMHRLILNLTDPKIMVDHINHNGLDNRKENMRIANSKTNCYNKKKINKITSSNYKGVYFHKNNKKWCSRIKQNYKRFFLGYFNSEEEAALVYNKKAKELFGEFACLNVIEPVLRFSLPEESY
jgi:hypothetical protein